MITERCFMIEMWRDPLRLGLSRPSIPVRMLSGLRGTWFADILDRMGDCVEAAKLPPTERLKRFRQIRDGDPATFVPAHADQERDSSGDSRSPNWMCGILRIWIWQESPWRLNGIGWRPARRRRHWRNSYLDTWSGCLSIPSTAGRSVTGAPSPATFFTASIWMAKTMVAESGMTKTADGPYDLCFIVTR